MNIQTGHKIYFDILDKKEFNSKTGYNDQTIKERRKLRIKDGY